MKEIKTAILIPVHNRLSFTSKCLSNLNDIFKDMGEPASKFIVVVIDDGSVDGTKEWIINNYPETVILEGNGKLWWSGGINKGIKYAIDELGCNYVLWWNNDILCAADYFSSLLTIIDSNDSNIIIGSKVYYADVPEKIWAMGGFFDTRSGLKYPIGTDETDSEKFNQVIEVDWLPGMGTVIEKSVFEKIGYVNETDFPQYHGDSDFTFRAKLAGYPVKVFPQLKIWNDKSSSGLQHYNSFRMLIKSLYDFRSHYHLGKDIRFYRKYAKSPLAYKTLFSKYSYYIGGFLKWRILSWIGIEKENMVK
jgi:GT2 family glycosyltransferase